MIALKEIEDYLSNKDMAVIGASTDRKKFGNIVLRFLKKRGFNVYPVNPRVNEIEGEKCFTEIKDVPAKVKAAIFITKPEVTEKIIENVISGKTITHIWLQPGSENENAIDKAKQNGLNIICNECIMMFVKQPGFPHSVHRFFKKTFGEYPQ
ncbi:MAG TPA: CoA-binding protein [Bacteroidales bacterium]|nr:CoA-binding protein [Bacteroidales bacterium]HPS17419.1 CoA-binding protein [Bacteroidales bacterium]